MTPPTTTTTKIGLHAVAVFTVDTATVWVCRIRPVIRNMFTMTGRLTVTVTVASEPYDYGVQTAMTAYTALCLGHRLLRAENMLTVVNPHFHARSGGQLEINLCLQ